MHSTPGIFARACRSLGFDIVAFLRALSLPYLQQLEPKKVVIEDSALAAFGRCLVHLPPLAVTLILLRLNLGGFYIGEHLQPSNTDQGDALALGFIQVAAKIQVTIPYNDAPVLSHHMLITSSQELLVIAGVGATFFHVIGSYLLRDGIPLGIAVAGFSFARPSYLWSSALWGGVSGTWYCKRKGAQLFAQITMGCTLALAVGPASAILMLPRIAFCLQKTWHSFSTAYYVKGTASDYWPDELTANNVGGPLCLGTNSSNFKQCISRGSRNLESYYSYALYKDNYRIGTQETGISRFLDVWPGESTVSAETWAFAPHAATSQVAYYFWYDPQWNPGHLYPLPYQSRGQRSGSITSQASAVRTVCAPDIQTFSSNTTTVSLPLLEEYRACAQSNSSERQFVTIQLPKPIWGTSHNALTNNTSFTTVWVAIANATSITAGLVLLGPVRSNTGTVRDGFVCSIDARWNKVVHTMMESSRTNITLKAWGNPVSVAISDEVSRNNLRTTALPVNNGDWRHVAADRAWLEALSPVTQNNQGPNFTMSASGLATGLENVFVAANLSIPSVNGGAAVYEPIISTYFADGMSRVGLERVFTHDGQIVYTNDRSKCENVTSNYLFCPKPIGTGSHTAMAFQGYLTGYAFNASRATDYLAIAVLLVYVVVALAHISHLLLFRRRSGCWDTLEELLVLAQTSKVSDKDLSNTCAGIKRFRTMSLNTRIRTVGSGVELVGVEDHEELQLLIGAAKGEAQMHMVEPKAEYGKT